MTKRDAAETFETAEAAFIQLQAAAHTLDDALWRQGLPSRVDGYDAATGTYVLRVGVLVVRLTARSVQVLRRRARHEEAVALVARGRPLRCVVDAIAAAARPVAEAA